ncbi:MAG: DUF5802 family protein [Halovenus sp.]
MFEHFSSGYYLGRLYVEPAGGETPAMCRTQYRRVNEHLYAEGTGVESLDRPLVMKVGTTHLTVTGEEGMPADTLAVPEQVLESAGIENPPELSEVFLAKADRARQLLALDQSA